MPAKPLPAANGRTTTVGFETRLVAGGLETWQVTRSTRWYARSTSSERTASFRWTTVALVVVETELVPEFAWRFDRRAAHWFFVYDRGDRAAVISDRSASRAGRRVLAQSGTMIAAMCHALAISDDTLQSALQRDGYSGVYMAPTIACACGGVADQRPVAWPLVGARWSCAVCGTTIERGPSFPARPIAAAGHP